MIYEVNGNYYHNRENAYEAAREQVTFDDLYDELQFILSFDEILWWCLKNDSFLEYFQEQICEAEENAINEHYLTEVDFSLEEEEEEFKTEVEFLDEEEE